MRLPTKEGVYRDQFSRVADRDLAVAELGTEALQEPDLLVGQLERGFSVGLLETQKSIVHGEQVTASPHAAYATGTDRDAAQRKLMGDTDRTVRRVLETVVEDRLLRIGGQSVGVRTFNSEVFYQGAHRPCRSDSCGGSRRTAGASNP